MLRSSRVTSESSTHPLDFLLERRNEAVIIERDRERIDELAEELDCGYIQGGGSKPAILREAHFGASHLLPCLSDDDQDNLVAGRRLLSTKVLDRLPRHRRL